MLTRLHELPAKDRRPKIHFINPLERLGEIKRRTDFVGIFPNEAPRSPITQLIGALLLEQNDEWAVQRGRLHEPGNHRSFEL
jgi:putative transposase